MYYNKAIVFGVLGKDIEPKITDKGTVVNFSIATNKTYEDKNGEKKTETEWHNIEAWGSTANFAGKYGKKGSEVFVEGELKTDSYTNKDGVAVSRTKIKTNNIQIKTKHAEASSEKTETSKASIQTEEYANQPQEEDLPF